MTSSKYKKPEGGIFRIINMALYKALLNKSNYLYEEE